MKTVIALVVSALSLTATNPALAADTAPAMPQTTKYKIDKRAGGQLLTTTAKLQVLSAPKADSKVLQEYDAGSMMAVIGEVPGTGYLYVSPCNACENGFVSKTELHAKARP